MRTVARLNPFAPAVAALARYTFLSHDERGLYDGLAAAFDGAGVGYERERVLGAGNRVDFYLPAHRLAVEVKVQGSPASILRQLTRYAACEVVGAILLVTNRATLARIPSTIANKPAMAVRLTGPFG